MNKLVYLFELDSVRNTEEEILLGQQAMYEEIVVNGNKVVLSYNQVADARAFLCAIENPEQYKYMIELFKKGYVKFSRYKNMNGAEMYTASQYMQEAIELNLKKGGKNKFIFSGLPIQSTEKELLECMYKAIKYSNPALLDDYVIDGENKEQKLKHIEFLKRYVSTILALSIEKQASNPVKENGGKKFMDFMDLVLTIPEDYFSSELWDTVKIAYMCLHRVKKRLEVWQFQEYNKDMGISSTKAICTGRKKVKIDKIKEKQYKHMNRRSSWHTVFVKKQYDNLEPEMAEAIVNLVYNYVIEDSISGVSKHYEDFEVNDESKQCLKGNKDSFYRDFSNRLELFWREYKNGVHKLRLGESATTVDNYNKYEEWENFPHWDTAVRIIAKENKVWKKSLKKEVEKEIKKDTTETAEVKLYEEDFAKEKRIWNTKLANTLMLQFLIAVFYILLMWGYEQISSGVENAITEGLTTVGQTLSESWYIKFDIVKYFVLLIASTILAKLVSTFIDIPDIMESVRNIAITARDAFRVMCSNKKAAYRRMDKEIEKNSEEKKEN